MIRYVILAATFLSVLWMPWPITVMLMTISSMLLPVAGIIFGVMFDMIYAPVGAIGIPLGIMWGASASVLGVLMSRFIRSRIMGA